MLRRVLAYRKPLLEILLDGEMDRQDWDTENFRLAISSVERMATVSCFEGGSAHRIVTLRGQLNRHAGFCTNNYGGRKWEIATEIRDPLLQ